MKSFSINAPITLEVFPDYVPQAYDAETSKNFTTSLPILTSISNATNLDELEKILKNLKYDDKFKYGSYHCMCLFKPTPSWKKITASILGKIWQLIQSSDFSFQNAEHCEKLLNLLTLLYKNPFISKSQRDAIKLFINDKEFTIVLEKFLKHPYSRLPYIIALQNVFNLCEEAPSKDPILDPLRYIALIVLANRYFTKDELSRTQKQKLAKEFKYSSYKQVKIAIKGIESYKDYTKINDYLNNSIFKFLHSSIKISELQILLSKQAKQFCDFLNTVHQTPRLIKNF